MTGFATMLLVWIWLGLWGGLAARYVFRTTDPWVVAGASIPLALLTVGVVFFPLGLMFDHPNGWVIGSLILFVGTVILVVKRNAIAVDPMGPFGLSRFGWGCLMSLGTAASVPIHNAWVTGPGERFGLEFSMVSLGYKGGEGALQPLLHQGVEVGTLVWLYLNSVMGMYAGGGPDLLSSIWVLHHLLLFAALFSAFAVGRRLGGLPGGFFVVLFLFFGLHGATPGLIEVSGGPLLGYALLLTGMGLVPFKRSVGPVLVFTAMSAVGLLLLSVESPITLIQFLLLIPVAGMTGRVWSKSKVGKVVSLLLVALMVAGGFAGVNRTLAAAEKLPDPQRKWAFRPFYPSPESWLVDTLEFDLDGDLLRAAKVLSRRGQPGEKMSLEGEPNRYRDAAFVGLAGLSLPGGRGDPLQRDQESIDREQSFWVAPDSEAAKGLATRWFVSIDEESAELLEADGDFRRVDRFGSVVVWLHVPSKTKGPKASQQEQ